MMQSDINKLKNFLAGCLGLAVALLVIYSVAYIDQDTSTKILSILLNEEALSNF
ncbi:hypothetical protein VBD025_00865 [Virgibacillus flavescens]|uniref:hypothetical protein n=1 Tax=Virgibacillus flavescens TaxID=1611422 RepID=UPI003D325796